MKLFSLLLFVCFLAACSGTKQPAKIQQPATKTVEVAKKMETPASDIPESYKEIVFPPFAYTAPFPADSRVQISEKVTGYVIENRSLPLIHFNIFFEEPHVTDSLQNKAANELLSFMFRRGGSEKLSPQVLDDSLEFIAASLAGSVGTFTSAISVECMTKDFPQLMELAKEVFLHPAFDSSALEIQKANAINGYEHRYDTPKDILAALDTKVNYKPNPRLWTATAEEYRNVKRNDLVALSKGRFQRGRIVFALAGDFNRDSMVTELKRYFESWPSDKPDSSKIPPMELSQKTGIFLVDKDITQANIQMSAPFVKRPHPDYYPTAVASFILGGGSFSSRLMATVRSDNGLAYSIHSYAENSYRDQGRVFISLQTKVESAALAIDLIQKEIEKLAKEGPTDAELEQAKKTLIEGLPSLFDSPASTSILFAQGDLLGKKDSHYIDYVQEINAVTKEQVQQMIAKYFDPKKMAICIVGPESGLKDVGTFTVVPLDSLDMRQ